VAQDIYIARAEGELALEEELYWALVNIYRSPAVLFELTKKKEV
jgi:piezo-type mechanosensitive ion channel component 1/2